MKQPKIETERLILRNWATRDQKDIVENINNLRVSQWLLVVPYPYKMKDAIWWMNNCKVKAKEKPRKDYSFAIELREEARVIGGISIGKIDEFQGVGTLGYWLGENYWRNGYGSEALEKVLDFAFRKLKLRRLEAAVFEGNPSSGKLLEKYGFVQEGYKRKFARSKATGKIHNEFIYGLLREEWRQR